MNNQPKCTCTAHVRDGAFAVVLCQLHASAQDLLDALKDAIKECRCTLAERDSGHLVDCFVPHAKEVIAKAEEATFDRHPADGADHRSEQAQADARSPE